MKIKEYIRSTHIFDNEKREWIRREVIAWNRVDGRLDTGPIYPRRWSLGVHALENDQWDYLHTIINRTIDMYKNYASDSTEEFLEFIKTTPDYRKIIKQHIMKELESLILFDVVQVREKEAIGSDPKGFVEYWDS